MKSLNEEVRRYLEDAGARINAEIRSYPTPIARCDEQLSQLLERREGIFRLLHRTDALIEEFIHSPIQADDETEKLLRSRLKREMS
ncbi:MAG: hypothetical protein ACREUO_06580 [Burkholderiales bacterium]